MTMVRAANLDTVVEFQEFVTGVDEVGSPTQTWRAIAGTPTRAQQIPIQGAEMVEAGKLTADESIRLKIRRCSEVVPKARVVIGNKVFNIVSVSDYGRREGYMLLWCEEKT